MNMRTENKEKKEYVLFILDESGSMSSCKKATIDGFNEQIQELKKTKDIKTFVSLVKFNSSVNTLFWNKPLEEVEELTNNTFEPNGMTSMLDAIGISINKLQNDTPNRTIDDISFLVFIISDGAENNSREFTWDSIGKIMKTCEEDKAWTITYMGANQDLSIVQTALYIPTGNIMMYNNTSTGTGSAFTTMSNGTANYRSARSTMTVAELQVSGVVNTFYSSVGGSSTEITS